MSKKKTETIKKFIRVKRLLDRPTIVPFHLLGQGLEIKRSA